MDHIYISDRSFLDHEPLPSGSLKELSQLSTYISASEKEIGYAVDFTKPYIEIRSAYLVKSLHSLAQSVQLSERHQGISYEKGSGEFLRYIECFAKMIQVGWYRIQGAVYVYGINMWNFRMSKSLLREFFRILHSEWQL